MVPRDMGTGILIYLKTMGDRSKDYKSEITDLIIPKQTQKAYPNRPYHSLSCSMSNEHSLHGGYENSNEEGFGTVVDRGHSTFVFN